MANTNHVDIPQINNIKTNTKKDKKNDSIDIEASIPNEIIFEIITNYLKSQFPSNTPYELSLKSSNNAIHADLETNILNNKVLFSFDIKINKIKNNNLSISLSNLSIGSIKISNKLAKPLISQLTNDKLLVSNKKSDIEMKINLNNILNDKLSIYDISIHESDTKINLKIKM